MFEMGFDILPIQSGQGTPIEEIKHLRNSNVVDSDLANYPVEETPQVSKSVTLSISAVYVTRTPDADCVAQSPRTTGVSRNRKKSSHDA